MSRHVTIVDHWRRFPLRIDFIPAKPVDVPPQVQTERHHCLRCRRVAFLDQLVQDPRHHRGGVENQIHLQRDIGMKSGGPPQ